MAVSEIKFTVQLDKNKIPEKIEWEATDSEVEGKTPCKSILLSLWDPASESTLRIDLWTKEMKVDEMKKFVHQTMATMADTFERATGEKEIAGEMREFSHNLAKKMELLDKAKV